MKYATFYVLINCDSTYENFVIKELKKIKSVKDIQGVFGIYDIIIRVETCDAKDMDEIISSQIQKIDRLTSTLTLPISNPTG